MIKKIEVNGYNTVEIKKRYPTGRCLCDVSLVELDKDEKEVVVKSDTNILFTSEQLELSAEEIAILNPLTTTKMPIDKPKKDIPPITPPTVPTVFDEIEG